MFIHSFFVSSFHLSAPVSRIAKYFRQDGTPLITVGGYTYDFVQNKTTCDNEYHMLIRVGLLSFETIADFTVDIMKKWVNNTRISFSLSVIYKIAFCNPFFFVKSFLYVSFNFYDIFHIETHIACICSIFLWKFPIGFSSKFRTFVPFLKKNCVFSI